MGISFGNDKRKPLNNPSVTADADMLLPVIPSKKIPITIGKHIPVKVKANDTPGPIYDVHVSINHHIVFLLRLWMDGLIETSQFQIRPIIHIL